MAKISARAHAAATKRRQRSVHRRRKRARPANNRPIGRRNGRTRSGGERRRSATDAATPIDTLTAPSAQTRLKDRSAIRKVATRTPFASPHRAADGQPPHRPASNQSEWPLWPFPPRHTASSARSSTIRSTTDNRRRALRTVGAQLPNPIAAVGSTPWPTDIGTTLRKVAKIHDTVETEFILYSKRT
uniref:Uncharacterized protein n=1 Tax=Plectus sambesii TaxID=2011161 RepID=A0A914VYJ2_9BILA